MTAGDWKNGTNLDGKVVGQLQAGTTATTLYAVPSSGTEVKLGKVVFSNESASAVTVSYGVAMAGNTPGAAGTFTAKTWPLGAAGSTSATVDATELDGMYLGPGDVLWFLASAATSVTGTASALVSH